MIRISHLTFRYADAAEPSLRDIDLEIGKGEFVLLTGPSGGGKSSLCRLFNGLIPHFYGGSISGQVTVGGQDTLKSSTRELATRVGLVFQDPENQLVSTTVEREVAFGLENLSLPGSTIGQRISEALNALGITDLRHRQLYGLSGGEKQKVVLASVLALRPGILVLDEPTSELDPGAAEDVLTAVARLNREAGLTVVIAEHRLERLLPLADRLIVLDRGRVVVDGPVREVITKDYDELSTLGVGLPPLVRLAAELRGRGKEVDGVPLTLAEGRALFEPLFGEARAFSVDERRNGHRLLVDIAGLSHTYPGGVVALREVSLKISEGEFVSVMGRNASGKTTLVKHLNRLLTPTGGRVTVDGIDTRQATTAALSRTVGFIFQNPNDHLIADTVGEEVAFSLKHQGFGREEIDKRVGEMLERFGLTGYRERHPRSLSGGEKQRVALASVLAGRPRLLVLDEPTRGMEHRLKNELIGFLSDYCAQGNTVVLVSHDVELVAGAAGRVVLMNEGRVEAWGEKHAVLTASEVFAPQINRLVRSFKDSGVPKNILTVGEALAVL